MVMQALHDKFRGGIKDFLRQKVILFLMLVLILHIRWFYWMKQKNKELQINVTPCFIGGSSRT